METYAGLNPGSMSCLPIVPSHARALAAAGWTKQSIKKYVLEHSESPFPTACGGRGAPILPVEPSIDDLMIVAAGGPGAWTGLLRSAGGRKNGFVSRKIELPRNWNKLVARYGTMVPTCAAY